MSKEKKASKNIWVGGFFAEFRYVTYSSKWLISFIEHFQPHFTVKFIEVLDPIENSIEPKNGIKNETNYESFSGWAINRPFCRLTIFQEKNFVEDIFEVTQTRLLVYFTQFRFDRKKNPFFNWKLSLTVKFFHFFRKEIKNLTKISS